MIEDDARFVCLAFRNVPVVFPNEERRLSASPVVTVLGRVPFDVDEFWRAELGKFFVDRVKESTLVVLASAEGHEELDLSAHARRVFLGLLLQGVPHIQGAGIELSGDRRDGYARVSGYAEHERYVGVLGAPRRVFDEQAVTEAGRLADGLQSLDRRARRFLAGFRSLERGLRERRPEIRVQDFLRALEALVMPEIGSTRRQFVERVKTFAVVASDAVLSEIYDLRSRAEHLHHWRGAMPQDLTEEEAEARALLRTFQAESVALHCYRQVLREQPLGELVADESRLKRFWDLPTEERAAQWGPRFDADAVTLLGKWRTLSGGPPATPQEEDETW